MSDVICAACGASAPQAHRCAACGEDPRLEGRYALARIVGHGAVGTTYRAQDEVSGETVAIKEMPLRPTTPRDQVRRIEREARVLGELRHDRIPACRAHFTAGQGKHRAFYLVQDFVDGPTLAEEMAGRRYTEDEVLGILDEICAVLEYLHGLAPPVIHRDLKPKNLIRRAADGRLTLIDFGAVRDLVQDPGIGGSTVAGTYGYMAPEQFRGEATPRSDLYAVGAMAVELLSRRALIDLVGVDHQLDWQKAVHASPATRALVERLLSASPEMRPASAKRVRAEIARIRAGEAEAPVGRAPDPSAAARRAVELSKSLPVPRSEAGQPRRPVVVTDELRRKMGARDKTLATVLAFVGGAIGAHQWYLGKWKLGFLYFILGWITFFTLPSLISIVQGIRMLKMSQQQFDEKYNPALAEMSRGDTLGVAEQIRALHQLVEEGALTEDEFAHEKARLLGQRAPGTLATLGRDLASTIFEQFEQNLDALPHEVADQLGKHRKKLEAKGLLRRQRQRNRGRTDQRTEARGYREGGQGRDHYLDG